MIAGAVCLSRLPLIDPLRADPAIPSRSDAAISSSSRPSAPRTGSRPDHGAAHVRLLVAA